MEYPVQWEGLESPSQRYELLLTLEELVSAPDRAPIDQHTRDFILDDISADDRPEGIVGGCLLNAAEQERYFAFGRAFAEAILTGAITANLRAEASRLLGILRETGVPL